MSPRVDLAAGEPDTRAGGVNVGVGRDVGTASGRLHGLGIVERARRELVDPLMRSAYSLMLNSVATALFGLIFWVVAARLRDSRQVGQDSALIASMMTLSSIFQLNLANTITRFLPQAGPRTKRWVLGAYAIAVVATVTGAVAFVELVPAWSKGLRFLGHDAQLAIVFVAACALWSVFGLQDAVMTALRRAPWVPLENSLFGVLKVAALVVLVALAFGHAVFVSWVLPMVALLLPVNYLIFRRFIPAHVRRHPDARPVAELLPSHKLRRFLAGDYLGSVAQQAALALPALLVVGLLGSSANAYFYVPFMLVTSFDTLFFNPSVSLVVEGSFESGTAAQLIGRVVSRLGKLVIPGVLVMVLAAPLLLLPFGTAYSAHGAATMRVLALASVFRIAITLFAAVARVQGRGGAIFAVYGATVALLVPLSVVFIHPFGIEGVAMAWLLANAAVALAVAPSLIRLLRAGGHLPKGGPRSPLPARRRAQGWAGHLRTRARSLRARDRSDRPRQGAGVPWQTMARLGMLASAAAVAVSFPGAPSGVRFGVLLAFLCTAPGTALLGALEPTTVRVHPAAVLAIGLALGALGAQILLLLGAWWPAVAMPVAAAACLCTLIVMQGWRSKRMEDVG
jgi:O-antigen/teichoic acid export membrane protein